jgi:hypothetical protein
MCKKSGDEVPLASLFDGNGEFAEMFSVISGYNVRED